MNVNQGGAAARPRTSQTQQEPVSGRQRRDATRRPGTAPPADRQAARIAAAEQSLADAYAYARTMGVDPDVANTAFAVLRDSIAQVKACSEHAQRELSMAQYEWGQARRRRETPAPYSAAAPVIPDVPGFSLCPNPEDAETPAQFMDALRMYRIWAGKPSYRVMQRQCNNRFAASTIYTALRGDDLPSLDMVQAIIIACGGPDEHRHGFVQAWRRLKMAEQAVGQPPLKRPLYPVSETA
jgi:hypothetical protein